MPQVFISPSYVHQLTPLSLAPLYNRQHYVSEAEASGRQKGPILIFGPSSITVVFPIGYRSDPSTIQNSAPKIIDTVSVERRPPIGTRSRQRGLRDVGH